MTDLVGTAGNDSLIGTVDPETIDGGDGNDYIVGNDAAVSSARTGSFGSGDSLIGGNGNDTIYAGQSSISLGGPGGYWSGTYLDTENDTIDAGAGDDRIFSSGGNDSIDGGDGFDWLYYAYVLPDAVTLSTTGGMGSTFANIEEFLIIIDADGAHDHSVTLGAGDDQLYLRAGTADTRTTVDMGAGDDVVSLDFGGGSVSGGDGDDVLGAYGGSGATVVMDGGAGDDQLTTSTSGTFTGGTGTDTLSLTIEGSGRTGWTVTADDSGALTIAGPVSGTATGFEALKILKGTRYADRIDGTAGDDQIDIGSGGLDVVRAGDGDDVVTGFGLDRVELFGEGGDDVLYSGEGDDLLVGGDGDDTISTEGGASILLGGNGDDELSADAGDAALYGGLGGIDSLRAGTGDNILVGDSAAGLSGVEGEVYRAYQAVFGRAPDADGYAIFVDAIRLGQLDPLSMIAEFTISAEFEATYGDLDNAGFVEAIFANVLPDNSDATGQAAFVAALDDGSLSRAEVVQALANSPEFTARMVLPSTGFATNVAIDVDMFAVYRGYVGILGREPDADGFLTFTAALQAGVTPTVELLNSFIDSPEFASTYGDLSNREFVETLYANVLPDNQDAAGRDAFTAALDNGEVERAEVVLAFLGSFEFMQRTEDSARAYILDTFASRGDSLRSEGGTDVMLGGIGEDGFEYAEGALTILDFVSGQDIIDTGFGPAYFETFAEFMATGAQAGLDTVFDFGDGNRLVLSNVDMDALTADDFLRFDAAPAARPKPVLDPVSEVLELEAILESFDAQSALDQARDAFFDTMFGDLG